MSAAPADLVRGSVAARTRSLPIAATVPVVAITALAAILRLWSFASVAANPFYDAAVRSMSLSWHNFFFGAFEPGAQVAVDKAPADLWLQVLSVKLFGFSSTALRLPEVTAGILAVPLLYDLVRRLFGHRAGLGAAAAMAVFPAAILTSHSDTMDSAMMLFDLLAAWLIVVGAQKRRVLPLIGAGAALGLAFEVKLFQGLIVAPALAVLMVLAVDLPLRRRLVAFAGSIAAFLVTGLGWIAAASLTPLGSRPWPIGSTNGSIWNVVFVFNGLDRLRGTATAKALALDPPGPLRFFGTTGPQYLTQIGTLLLAALVLGAVALLATLARKRTGFARLQIAGVAFFGVWLVVGVGLLSHMSRLQPRYLEAVTPAIAAVVGVGLAQLVGVAKADRRAGALLLAAVGATVLVGIVLVSPPTLAAVAGLAGFAGCVALVVWRPRLSTALVALGLVAVLAVPAASALTVAREHRSNAGLPVPTPASALSAFLLSHQHGARYEVASPAVARASTLIIRDAKPVLMLTSLYGQPLLTSAQLQHLVASNQVRYLLGRGACGKTGQCPPVVRWAHAHARDVSRSAGLPPGTISRLTVKRVR
jgi:4-amino-4-deoxy-L-arabinose transferase-like glycosyltransferase